MKNRILFISTKNLDYIRNVQEIKLLEESGSHCRIIGSYHKSYFIRLLKVYIKILFTRISNYDEVWIGFAPQLIFPFFWKFRRKKLTIDFFISLYDTLCYDRKIVSTKTFLGRCLYYLDYFTLRKADEIICDTKTHRDYFKEEFKVLDKNYKVLYLEADTSLFYPRKGVRPPHLSDKFIVLYFGSILPLQGVEVILSAINGIREENSIYFIMIGPVQEDLKEKTMGRKNVMYIDWLSEPELARYIAMADLCLAGHFHGEIKKAARTIPGKAYIYKAMNKKIILGENCANREIFTEDESTFFVPMGNPDALAQKILAIRLQTEMER